MAEIVTLEQALEAWDAGEPLTVFAVESEGASQEELWGAALETLRAKRDNKPFPTPAVTPREREVIDSIVYVAEQQIWKTMIRRHVHDFSPQIEIRKPRTEETPAAQSA